MKFKAKDLRGESIELHSTRNVTLFESPEFGHMVVDGKMADTKAVDSGKLRVVLQVTARPGNVPAPMGFVPADFNVAPQYFVTRAEFSVHGLVLGEYTCGYDYSLNHYVYNFTIPEKYQHESKLLGSQLYLLVKGL